MFSFVLVKVETSQSQRVAVLPGCLPERLITLGLG
jgi:hypothetical protein